MQPEEQYKKFIFKLCFKYLLFFQLIFNIKPGTWNLEPGT